MQKLRRQPGFNRQAMIVFILLDGVARHSAHLPIGPHYEAELDERALDAEHGFGPFLCRGLL